MAAGGEGWLVLSLFFSVSTLSLLHLTAAKTTAGFSLELLHRDSPLSPLYPGNLTELERLQRLVKISDARVQYLKSAMAFETSNLTTHTNIFRPKVGAEAYPFLYVVRVGIGTPYKGFQLLMDTGSELVWTQCKPCTFCFPQKYPMFDPKQSQSYQKLPCQHPLCKNLQCVNGECIYRIEYAGGQSTKGVLSSETFTFPSNNHSLEAKSGMFFGCSNLNRNFQFSGGIDGILGMNRGTLSLVTQLSNQISQRFSYCLVESALSMKISSFLRFGSDIVIKGGNVQTTPFVQYSQNPKLFALNLVDITVGTRRMNFPPGTFTSKPDGTGGCVIDSGSAFTYIDQKPYESVKNVLVDYFARLKLKRINQRPYTLDLCYTLPKKFSGLPKFIFHFQGADLEVIPENAFLVSQAGKFFCLAMKPEQGLTTIGAMQQQNVRFIYDGSRNALSFVSEDCSKDVS
ncbi:PREDICTED: aspartic proteinase nepenthesin-1-like [Nelumbo nucifera]|uniref:Peptidase A1 domain-containing protein n=2 Tax=Nelumbo nucifera TaxID=4432 RepID=A0A822Y102_NELNU|nr:PREDICTED: aspartic proteinase nepenthesin-1-like [Nelumbo nucifera]DAD23318.1 TPA_asm: hypothetical protein HUJ06_024781 [Nelumbo nucifera]